MNLDTHIRNLIKLEVQAQKMFDALRILDEKTYDKIIEEGSFLLYNVIYYVDADGKVFLR